MASLRMYNNKFIVNDDSQIQNIKSIQGIQNTPFSIQVPTQGAGDLDGVGISIIADAGGSGGLGNHAGGIVNIYGGAKAGSGADGYVKIGHTAGAPANTLDDDSLFVKGKLEVEGVAYFPGGWTTDEDITIYDATNDGNPQIKIGSGDAEEVHIQTIYDTGAQTLNYVLFQTDVASAVADKGKYVFNVDGTNKVQIDDAGICPETTDSAALGTISLMWSDLFLANGGVINFNNGGYTATHSTGLLTLSGQLAISGNLTDYAALNDANPEFKLGSADAEELHIQSVYDTGAQTLNYVLFQTDAVSATADKGQYKFNVDGTEVVRIDDNGIEVDFTGTAKSNSDLITLTNKGNAADMDATETSILFNQWYYDVVTPAVADAARISIGTEQDWTSTGTTQDAYMAFHTALNGTVGEKFRIASDGLVSLKQTGTNYLFSYEGAVADDGTLDLPDASSGFAFVTFDEGADWAIVNFTDAGVVTLGMNTANVIDTDTDAKYCIFDNGTKVTVKNRIGLAKNIKVIAFSN